MAVTLDDVRGMGDPLKQHNHELRVPDVPGGGNDEKLTLHLVDIVIPGFGSESFERAVHGFTTKHAGRGTFPRTLSANFVESADLSIWKILRAWHSLQWNPETGAQAPEDIYKTDGFLILFGNDRQESYRLDLEGLYIEDVGDVTLSGETSDKVLIPVTFSYDHVDSPS